MNHHQVQGIAYNMEYSYGLSRATARVRGFDLVTDWVYRDETYTHQAIQALIREALSHC